METLIQGHIFIINLDDFDGEYDLKYDADIREFYDEKLLP